MYYRFYISLRDVGIYTNDEMTRTFVSVRVVSGDEQLLSIVKEFNGVLSSYKLPPFYEVMLYSVCGSSDEM